MSTKKKVTAPVQKPDFEKELMAKIRAGEVGIRPRWRWIAGSVIGVASLAGLMIGVVYLTNLVFFLIRRRGPVCQWRLEELVDGFPWWLLVAAIVGMAVTVRWLRKYDFSYKKNFLLIVAGFIAAILIAAWGIDRLGLNENWARRGPMRRFYQQLEPGDGRRQHHQRSENGLGGFLIPGS